MGPQGPLLVKALQMGLGPTATPALTSSLVEIAKGLGQGLEHKVRGCIRLVVVRTMRWVLPDSWLIEADKRQSQLTQAY